jgi:hypothetical protein
LGKISALISLPAVPDEFEKLEEIVDYLNDLVSAVHDAITTIQSEFNGKIEVMNMLIKSSDALTFGEEVNDSWRIVRDGDNFSFQRREAGVWVEKGAFVP